MKKTYINPEINIVRIHSSYILSGSPVSFNGGGEGSIELQSGNATGASLSRGYDFDDDEDW